ncbi:MAG: peptidoglycan DD-metalloendopeptidase family protein [Chromatiales bacterium]|nr:peptidoglycan DD-metalloendopeptidase family protein [Chromatiales bacterium]
MHPERPAAWCWCLAAAGVLLVASPAAAIDRAAELQALRTRIAQIEAANRALHGDLDTGVEALRAAETAIGSALARIADLDRQLTGSRGEATRIETETNAVQATLARHRARLADQLRAAQRSRGGGLRVLLSQAESARLARMVAYHGYTGRARAAEIQATQAALDRLAELAAAAAAKAAEIESLRAATVHEQQRLDAERAERERVIAALRGRIQSAEAELTELRADERRLDSLVQQVRAAVTDVPSTVLAELRFGSRRGRLPWPAAGAVIARFGQPRAQALAWDGMLIATAPGAPVRAVAHGRVVYADWLRGYGLFTIIDHGEGFMTLYGHNEALNKTVGDWVEADEVIALAGDSGGRRQTALYFALRVNGQPRDPRPWLVAGG